MTDRGQDDPETDDDSGLSDWNWEEASEQGEEPDFEEAVSELERVESGRRRLGVVIGIGALLALGTAVVVAAEFRVFFFQPKMPIEKNEREVVRKTDDPQCRKLIADVGEISNEYYALESQLETHVPGEDLEAIREIDRKLATLLERLEQAEQLSHEANLRYDKSREELERWFSYTKYEVGILREIVAHQIARLTPDSAAGDTGTDGGDGDAGTTGTTGSAAAAPDAGSDRTPRERRDGAMVALHDAFENFRVWHAGDTQKHPCGDAEEGETAWRPDDWEARPDAGAESSQRREAPKQ